MAGRVGGSDTPEIADAVEAAYVEHVAKGQVRKGLLAFVWLLCAALLAFVLAVAAAHWLWRLGAIVWAST